MHGSVLFGADDFVANFVRLRLGDHTRFAGGYTALGVVSGDVFVGGVVYYNFTTLPFGNAVECSFAFDSPFWATRDTLSTICTYAFAQNCLNCNRVTALVAKSNARARRVIEKIGFKREGSHPRAMDGKEDAISYGLLREQCKWIKPRSEWKARKR